MPIIYKMMELAQMTNKKTREKTLLVMSSEKQLVHQARPYRILRSYASSTRTKLWSMLSSGTPLAKRSMMISITSPKATSRGKVV